MISPEYAKKLVEWNDEAWAENGALDAANAGLLRENAALRDQIALLHSEIDTLRCRHRYQQRRWNI